MISVTIDKADIVKGTVEIPKAIYQVPSWPSQIVFLSGTAQEVFTALGLTCKGKRQKEFLATAVKGDIALFMNGLVILVPIGSFKSDPGDSRAYAPNSKNGQA